MKLSRRGLLKEGGFFLLGATVGGLSLSHPGDLARATAAKQETIEVPWPYKKLNPEAVAEKAYDGYYKLWRFREHYWRVAGGDRGALYDGAHVDDDLRRGRDRWRRISLRGTQWGSRSDIPDHRKNG